jgi:hypothetical protein
MAKPNFYMVYIDRNKDVSYEKVEEKMDLSVDWYRIKENLWILYTTSDAEKWYKRLSPLAKNDGNILICELNINNRQGWMNKKFWKWVRREKDDT